MSADPTPSGKMGDLKVRTLSAIVMIAVAGSALWAGGWVFTAFVALIAVGLLWEWWGLISKFNHGALGRVLWMLGGLVYIGGACFILAFAVYKRSIGSDPIFQPHFNLYQRIGFVVPIIGAVVASDIGAYLCGRFIGGPKLAPRISPKKTWAGTIGGMVAASLWFANTTWHFDSDWSSDWFYQFMITGALISLISQLGDFFESWMKRKAGVKDSGNLIPGHGGLFDRLDGLIAVLFFPGLIWLVGLK